MSVSIMDEIAVMVERSGGYLWVGEEGDGVVDEVLTGHDPAKAVSKIYNYWHCTSSSTNAMFPWAASKAVSSRLASRRAFLLLPALPSSNLALSRLQWLPTVRVEAFPHTRFWSALFLTRRLLPLTETSSVPRRGYAEMFSRKKPHMNIGTIGLSHRAALFVLSSCP